MLNLLYSIIKKIWITYLGILLVQLIVGLSINLSIFATSGMIDFIYDMKAFVYYLLVFLGVNLVVTILNNVGNLLSSQMNNKTEYYIGTHIMETTFKIDYLNFEKSETFSLIDQINREYKEICPGIIGMINSGVRLLSCGISILVNLFVIEWYLPIALLALAVPSVLLYQRASDSHVNAWHEAFPLMRRFNYLSNVLTTRKFSQEIRVFQAYDYIHSKWEDAITNWQDKIQKANILPRIRIGLYYSILFVVSVGILYFMLLPLNNARMSIGTYIAIANAITSFVSLFPISLGDIVSQWKQVKEFERKFKIVEKLKGKDEFETVKTAEEIKEIKFNNVWYRYSEKEDYVIKGISFSINTNERVALVGCNGSGKTTLIKLLLGLIKPTKGVITVNGIDTNQMTPYEIKCRFGFATVFQNFGKFGMSIREHVMASNYCKNCNDDDIINTLKLINPNTDIVEKAPKGLDSILSKDINGGIELSGGEWQTIALARAMCSNANCLILDEPTAALDPLTEVEVYEQMFRLCNNNICIFITHRLGATTKAEKILVLDEGVIVECGSHDELIRKGEQYAELFNTQKQWYKA